MDQIYKVLIIDDEVDSFCNDEKVIKCRQERVELIKAHNISEFEAYLRNCDGYVDAIITDVNFSAGVEWLSIIIIKSSLKKIIPIIIKCLKIK